MSQKTLFPEKVTVGVKGRLLFEEHAELLRTLGFDITPFGTDTVVVNGVPEGYSAETGKAEALVGELQLLLEQDQTALPGVMEQAMAQKFAALGAAGATRITSPLEAQRLVDSLLQSDNPEFTSNGRRIISIVPAEELEKRF